MNLYVKRFDVKGSGMAERQDSIDRLMGEALPLFPFLDPEVEAAVDRMAKLVKHLDRTTDRTVGEFGLNTGEFRVLLKLRQAPEQRMTAGALAERLSLSTGAMTNRVDRLEEAGLVTRERDPKDRRSVFVAITSAGVDVLDAAVATQADVERRILSALTHDEQRRLNALLRKLVLAAEDLDAHGGSR
jgi:DNA-binding MarR family transcriptional regulator